MRAVSRALLLVSMLFASPAFSQAESVPFETARHIVRTRCAICHTAIPQEDGLNAASQPPKGIKFDTNGDIQKWAPLILEQAVRLKRMPPDNATHMSDEERDILRTWIDAGARVP